MMDESPYRRMKRQTLSTNATAVAPEIGAAIHAGATIQVRQDTFEDGSGI